MEKKGGEVDVETLAAIRPLLMGQVFFFSLLSFPSFLCFLLSFVLYFISLFHLGFFFSRSPLLFPILSPLKRLSTVW